jgi:hypothetical protein
MISMSIEKKKEYQERSRQKQLAKMNSVEYKEKQFKKALLTQENANEKARNKQLAIYKSGPPAQVKSKKPKPPKPPKAPKPPKPPKAIKQPKLLVSPSKQRKPIKSKGLVGVTRTRAEVELHDIMAALGCICCIKQGLISPFSGTLVSIHHMNGRTAPGCHLKVLPLCAWHHDMPIPKDNPQYSKYLNVFPIHAKGAEGGRVPWEKVNGTQEALLLEVLAYIGIDVAA